MSLVLLRSRALGPGGTAPTTRPHTSPGPGLASCGWCWSEGMTADPGPGDLHLVRSLEGSTEKYTLACSSARWVLRLLTLSLGASLWLHPLLLFPQGRKTVKSAACRQLRRGNQPALRPTVLEPLAGLRKPKDFPEGNLVSGEPMGRPMRESSAKHSQGLPRPVIEALTGA